MAGIHFDITGDNQNFIRALVGVQNKVRETSRMVEDSGESIENMFTRIAEVAGIAFSASQMKTFVDKVVEVRSYFQDIESSMEVFLGSEKKALDFTEKLQKYAYYNMFEFSDLAMASKQMIAYHTAVEDVIPELDKLSNIATGTKQPLMELVNMYNNARSTGYVATQQLGMWARQGILVKETLKEMGQEVAKSGATFEQLQMVIDKVTSEGGMFHNLMLNQMENISAEQGQLEDNLALMYNEIGQMYQEHITDFIKAESWLVDHYKEIAKVIMTVVTAYGAYRGALLLVAAAQKIALIYKETMAFITLAKEIKSATVALEMFNFATKMSPIGVIASVLATATAAFMLFGDSAEDTAEKSERFGESAREAASNANALFRVLQSAKAGSKTQKDAMNELVGVYREYGMSIDQELEKYDKEADKIEVLKDKHEQLIDVIRQEAIEKEKANDISAAEEDYKDEIDKINKHVKSDLSSEFTKADKGQLVNLIDENDIQGTAEKLKKYTKALADAKKKYGADASKYVSKEYQEYIKSLDAATEKAEKYSKASGVSASATKNAATMLRYQLQESAKLRVEQEKAVDSAKKAADSAYKTKDSMRDVSLQTRYAQMSTSEFADELKRLQKEYGKTNIDVDIWYKEHDVPSWMKGMDLNKTQALARRFGELAVQAERNGGKINIKGEGWKTAQELRDRAAEYSKATEEKQDEQEKAAREAERKAEEAKKNADKNAKTAAERRKQLAELDLKEREEREAQAQRTADAVADATIAAEQDAAKRERMEQDRQHEKDMQQVDDLEEEYRKKNYEAQKARWEAENKGKKALWADQTLAKDVAKNGYSVVELTKEQEDEVAAIRKQKNAEYNRLLLERKQEEIQAMRDYLKEYGSMEQQRLAITEEYEEKIRKAKTEGDKLQYREELNTKLGQMTYANISKGIDWKALFQGVGTMSKRMMQEMMGQLHAFVNTDEFRTAGAENQEKVVQLMSDLRDYLGTENVGWEDLSSAMTNFNNSLERLTQLQIEEKAAIQQQQTAKNQYGESSREYKEAVENTAKASRAVVEAQNEVKSFGSVLNNASDAVVNYTSKLDVSLMQVAGLLGNVEGFSELQGASSQLSAFKGQLDKTVAEMKNQRVLKVTAEQMGVQDIYHGGDLSPEAAKELAQHIAAGMNTGSEKLLSGISSIIGDASNLLSEGFSSALGPVAGGILAIPSLILNIANAIKGFVTGILDSFTELFKFEWLSDLVNSILEAVGNLVQAIFDLPANLVNSLGSIVTNGVGGLLHSIVNTITFGGFDSWFGIGKSNHDEMVNIQTQANDNLDIIKDRVERISYKLDKSYGATAIKTAEELKEYIRSSQEQIHTGLLAAGWDDYGGKHSEWYHRNKSAETVVTPFGVQHGYMERLKEAYGLNFNGTALQDFFDYLNSLEGAEGAKILHDIRENKDFQDIWYEWMRTNSYDEGAIADWITRWADLYDDLEEAQNKLNERLTTTTAENVFDDYLNSLYELANGSEDVFEDIADNWQKMVNKMVVNNIVGAKQQKALQDWYDNVLAKAYDADEKVYQANLNRAKEEYDKLVQQGVEELNRLRDMGIIASISGSSEQQSATANSIQNISYDQADSLVGIGLNHTILLEQGNATRDLILQNIQTLQVGVGNTLNELRNLTVQANGTRETMLKVMKERFESFDNKLTNIYKELQAQ